eukprot:11217920-Lingulodinium_polyedra.AAC.1
MCVSVQEGHPAQPSVTISSNWRCDNGAHGWRALVTTRTSSEKDRPLDIDPEPRSNNPVFPHPPKGRSRKKGFECICTGLSVRTNTSVPCNLCKNMRAMPRAFASDI